MTIERLGGSEIESGIDTVTSVDLNADISAGVAYVNGIRVVVPTTPVTYTASMDTYIDISSSGIISYSAVANGASAPAIVANSLRVLKVVTDATKITTVTRLKTPKNIFGISATQISVAPSNYFRNLSGPEQTTIEGTEFVISKSGLDLVFFPAPKKGDRLKDNELGTFVINEVRPMFGLAGVTVGYRVRTG